MKRIDGSYQYWLLVNERDLFDIAKKQQYQNVILAEAGELSMDDLMCIKESGKAVAFVFRALKDMHAERLVLQLRDAGLNYELFILPGDMDMFFVDHSGWAVYGEDAFPSRKRIERQLVANGYIMETDFTGYCGNCHAHLRKGEKYCKFCGTRRGEGAFVPFYNEVYALYGPPIRKKYFCRKCGYSWITNMLGGGEDSRFCPMCGRPKVKQIEKKMLKSFWTGDDDE